MKVLDLSFSEPEKNLLYDEELLKTADETSGEEILRFWESPSVFIVLGRTCSEEDDVEGALASRDRIPVLRRSSGGGTVVQGAGCLNFALVLSKVQRPELQSIHGSYQIILDQVTRALKNLGIKAEFRPVCDLVLHGTEKKFSGNAQRRGREYILHHGTLLYQFDLSLISRYLKLPKKMPSYRNSRPHHEFVANIKASPSDLRDVLAQEFLRHY